MYKVSVVICTYNRSKLLRGMLESLINQSLDRNLYEIIMVDNASIDNTKETVMDFIGKYSDWNLRYIYEPEQGLSNARNAGYENAKAKYVACIDDDAKADKHWLRNIVKTIEEIKPDILGGPIYPYYLTEKPKWFLDKYEIRSNGDTARFLENNEYIFGSNIIFKKQLLNLLGGFDSNLGMKGTKMGYGEETKLIVEARKRFKDVKIYYSPEMIVYHLVPAEKMRMKYFIKSSIIGGQYTPGIWEMKVTLFTRKNAIVLIKTLPGLLYELTIGLIFRNETHYRYSQNYIIEVICPRISILVGSLFCLLAMV